MEKKENLLAEETGTIFVGPDGSTLGDRIMATRGNFSREQFAERLNIHPQTLRKYEINERVPSADFVALLCETHSVSYEWLMTGQGQMSRKAHAMPIAVDVVYVPLVRARLSGGNGSFEVEADVESHYAFRGRWISRKGSPGSMVLMKVVGDSMEPEIREGDMVLIDQSQQEVIAGGIYAVGIDDMVMIKQVDPAPGKLVLRSYNARYSPIEAPLTGDLGNTVRIIGRCIWWCREAL